MDEDFSQDLTKTTPMLEQYQRIKAEYPDALLMYRMGDFYELFFEDAVIASRELQIALTCRNKARGGDVPMCGMPWHASKSYIATLIEKGYVVAICEQVEDPKTKVGKGLVARAVTQVITPGTTLDENTLEAASHNYLGCIQKTANNFAFVWSDISTGQWTGAEFSKEEDLWQWVLKMAPKELLVPFDCEIPNAPFFSKVHIVRQKETFSPKKAEEILCSCQHVPDLETLGLSKKQVLVQACASLVQYVEQTQKCPLDQLEPFIPLNLSRRMLIDEITERNLELFQTISGSKGKGTLKHIIKATITPMGGRLLEDMLHHPLRDCEAILDIQDAVSFFAQNPDFLENFRRDLSNVFDLERLIQRISLNRCSPKDFVTLRQSLQTLPHIAKVLEENLQKYPSKTVDRLLKNWDSLSDVSSLVADSLVDNPPALITEGGLFAHGYCDELDALIDLVDHGEQKLEQMLAQEREENKLPKLKLGYNRVFGYYYELSKNVTAEIPAHFYRRQSLVNAERFTTDALKGLEDSLLKAGERRKTLEYTLFLQLREKIAAVRERIIFVSSCIAHLDYWQSLAHVGRTQQWVMPTFDANPILDIVGGRHPVVESFCGRTNFVPNDIHLTQDRTFCLLTGPNMAGKSTILRQTALLCILAQMGSMVPAQSAHLGLVDKIFSRVGASDNLSQGESTFMVEMKESARILRQATKHSLVIFDEIGRGTSTYDGVALAWSIVEYLCKHFDGQLRTLFATHYHELLVLEGRLSNLFTMNIAIREYNNSIVFTHKLIPGPTDKSYGVEVARLAGVPQAVVVRARELLGYLESGKKGMQDLVFVTAQKLLPGLSDYKVSQQKENQKNKKSEIEHPLVAELSKISPEHMSPMEALALLLDWKKRFGKHS